MFTNKGKFKTENQIERGSSPFLFLLILDLFMFAIIIHENILSIST